MIITGHHLPDGVKTLGHRWAVGGQLPGTADQRLDIDMQNLGHIQQNRQPVY